MHRGQGGSSREGKDLGWAAPLGQGCPDALFCGSQSTRAGCFVPPWRANVTSTPACASDRKLRATAANSGITPPFCAKRRPPNAFRVPSPDRGSGSPAAAGAMFLRFLQSSVEDQKPACGVCLCNKLLFILYVILYLSFSEGVPKLLKGKLRQKFKVWGATMLMDPAASMLNAFLGVRKAAYSNGGGGYHHSKS